LSNPKIPQKPIWMVTHWFPKKRKPSQGIFILEHLKAFVGCGVPIEVISIQFGKGIWPSAQAQQIQYSGIEVTEITLTGISPKLWYAAPWLLMPMYKRYLKNATAHLPSPLCVHSHVALPAGYFGDFLAEQHMVPHVITEHWSKTQKHLKGEIFGFSSQRTRSLYQRASAITTVSEYLKESMFEVMDSPQTPIYITPNVIRHKGIEPVVKNQVPLKVLMVANWKNNPSDPKRPELALEALSNFSTESGREVLVTMAGGGDGQLKLKSLAKKLKIACDFTGFLDKSQLFELMHDQDLLVHASTTETFSLVIAEALVNGLPVVASEVGAIPEVLSSAQWGYLVENTVQGFCEALHSWNNKPLDPLRIYQENKSRFSDSTVVNSFQEVYSFLD